MQKLRDRRLPVDHPEYCYLPSNNLYGRKIEDLKSKFPLVISLDHDCEKYQGKWLEQFQKKALHVEVGCNAGHVLLEWAAAHPENLYIGIDWKFKGIFRAAEKAVQRKLENVVFLRAHAERLQFIFSPQEIHQFYLYFPDPWPKNTQSKNRFLNSQRFQIIHSLLRPQGEFHVKTDHPGYFKFMLSAFESVKKDWEVLELNHHLHEKNPEPEKLQIPDVTLFERIFIRQGIPIQSLKLQAR